MGLYNFQARFVTPILLRTKKHTIRAKRKYPDKPGNILHLYTGLRTKKAMLLRRVTCLKVEEIKIWQSDPNVFEISIDGQILSRDEGEQLARADGFDDFVSMMCFWDGHLPFEGHIIHWATK